MYQTMSIVYMMFEGVYVFGLPAPFEMQDLDLIYLFSFWLIIIEKTAH